MRNNTELTAPEKVLAAVVWMGSTHPLAIAFTTLVLLVTLLAVLYG